MEMKKILSLFILLILPFSTVAVAEKVNIEKQLIGIVGAVSGKVNTQSRELKTGDKIYLNETIFADKDSGTQILLLDQSTFTIGSESEVVMDTFIYDPDTNDGKIVASVKQGSLKVISGLISKKNPDSLTVKVPEGTLGSRGTEFQTMVSKKQTSTLLIGPGKNNTLGLRPGAVLVGNKLGSTLLNNPYNITTMQKGKAPDQAKKITKGQLKKFNKKMKALKVAKLEGASKEEKKQIKKEIKKELKAAGLEKEEIKALIKDNIQKDKQTKIKKEIEREEKKNKKDNKATKENKKNKKATKENKKAEKGKNKKEVKDVVRRQTIKKKDGTVIQQVTVINPKTKKFRRLQKITDKDGKVSYKESKGKVKKVKPKKVAKKKKISKKKKAEAKKKTKGNKGKAAAKKKKDNKKKATTSGNSGNKKKATNKKNNKKKKATNKKNNNKKKATNKKNNNKKKATNKNNKKKKSKPKVKKKPTPKKKAKPKPKVKKPPPKKKKINKAKKVTKKKVKKNKKKAKKKRNKK